MLRHMDVAGEKRSFERTLARVKALPDKHAQPMLAFYHECRKENLSLPRITNCLTRLIKISQWLGKPINEASEEDIAEIVENLDLREYTEWTKSSYRALLRKYYKYPWIKTSVRPHQKKLPEELVSEEEALKMIDACGTPRNKALLSTLYDIGCRPAEVLRLRVGHVTFDEYGAIITLSGKTGPRRVRGILCSPYLRGWLDSHPQHADAGAPMWPSVNHKGGYEYLGKDGLDHILQAAAKRAGIKKRMYPYLFRHSRATYNASFMTEAQLCEYHGWLQGSRMPAVYVHMSGRDVDAALLKHYNLVKEEEKKETPTRCPRCNEINAPKVSYCYKCGMPLSREVFVGMQETVEKTDKILQELLKDEEFKQVLLKKMTQLGISKQSGKPL